MNINNYISEIEEILNLSPIVSSYNLTIDRKTSDIAFISGIVDVRDGSTLDFKEFIEVSGESIEKYKYAYNCRRGSANIFRYDNASDPRARYLKSFPHHKHIGEADIFESSAIGLRDVLQELEKNYSFED